MPPIFRFKPLSFSWVAIHPNPKGIIQFIGGAFFGTFPTVSYRYLLRKLFEDGYTIIALPFRFSFRHWSIAIDLLKEQENLRKELIMLTGNNVYQERDNYIWLGHSLGCKYIALLEFLSTNQWQKVVKSCTKKDTYQKIETIIRNADLENISILGQPSLMIAPDISNTESAIPVHFFAYFLDKIGLGVLPTREQTQCFITGSELFNLTALISFDKDKIAGNKNDEFKSPKIQESSDVLWFIKLLKTKSLPILHEELCGKHLEPVGVKIDHYIVDFNLFDKFIEFINKRRLEQVAIQFITDLRKS